MGKDYWTLVGPNRGAAIIFTHLDFHSQRGQALWVRSRTTGPEHSNCHELDWMCAERYQKRKSDLVILITIADPQFLGAVSWHNGCFHYLFFYFGGEGWMKRVYFSWQLIAHLPWKSKQELRARNTDHGGTLLALGGWCSLLSYTTKDHLGWWCHPAHMFSLSGAQQNSAQRVKETQ